MGKSLGNAVSLEEFFNGNNPLLEKAYTPMTIRFFILQAQYRGTLDFSNEALQAAEKGLRKLLGGLAKVQSSKFKGQSESQQSTVSSQQNISTRISYANWKTEFGILSLPIFTFIN